MRHLRPYTFATVLFLLTASCSADAVTTSTTAPPATSTTVDTANTTTATTTPTSAPPPTVITTTTTTLAPTSTTTVAPTSTTTETPTTTMPVLGPIVTIPVGEEGIEYRTGGTDLETTGPNQLTVDGAGRIYVFDPVGLRVLRFDGDERVDIDLEAHDILSVTAMAAGEADLWLVEVFFAPERQRLHRMTLDGELVASVDLPEGFQLEDGLSGVLVAGLEDPTLEFGGGAFYGAFDTESQQFTMQSALRFGSVTAEPRWPDLVVDGVLVQADLTRGLGGLRYLGTAPDGTHVIERIDVLATAPSIEVVTAVEWYSAAGELIGSALVPSIQEQAVDLAPGVAVDSDGNVLVLLALAETVEVHPLQRTPGRITG